MPDTAYLFVVRAENTGVQSVPSQVSATAHTLPELSSVLDQARDQLSTGLLVTLTHVEPLSSTSVILYWKVCSY